MANSSINLVDDVESAFQSCLALLTSPENCSVYIENDETRSNADHAVTKFLDAVRQLDCFFIQKRQFISTKKPEVCANSDLSELESELQRKEALLQRHYDKVQALLNQLSGGTSASQSSGTSTQQQHSQNQAGGSVQPSTQQPPSAAVPQGVVSTMHSQLTPSVSGQQQQQPIAGGGVPVRDRMLI